MGLGPKGHPLLWKGEDLHQARLVSPRASATAAVRPAVRLGVHPLFFKQTRCLDFFFPQQTCLLLETPHGIFILPFFPFFFQKYSPHFIITVIFCVIVLQKG